MRWYLQAQTKIQCTVELFYPLQCYALIGINQLAFWFGIKNKIQCITQKLKIVIMCQLNEKKGDLSEGSCQYTGSNEHTRCPCPRVHNLSWKFQQPASEGICRHCHSAVSN